jgi:alpha-tubulin suppressor-like RCC1 family protein
MLRGSTLFCIGKRTPLPFEPFPGFDFSQVACASSFLIAVTVEGRALAFGDTTEAGLPRVHGGSRIALPSELGQRKVCSVACGSAHVLLLLDNGAIVAFGRGDEGRLGCGDEESSWTPRLVPSTPDIVKIACGFFHSAAVSASGELFTWGSGKYGALGHGDQSNKLVPTAVSGLANSKIISVACEKLSTAALDHFGTVFTFGFSTTPLAVEGYSVEKLAPQPRIAIPTGGIAKISASGKGTGFCLALRGAANVGCAEAPIPI